METSCFGFYVGFVEIIFSGSETRVAWRITPIVISMSSVSMAPKYWKSSDQM